jgi:P pilus assembly chaperone PapD
MKPAKLLFLLFFLSSNVYAAADLEIKTIRGIIDQNKFNLEFTIVNHGPASADHAGANVYFYANERLVISQTLTLSPLSTGVSRKESAPLDLPNQPITTVKVEVFDLQQPDLQPSTNFLQMNIKSPDRKKADLQIVDVKPAEDTGKQRVRAAWVVRLRNNGPDRVSASKLTADLEVFGEVLGQSEKRIERLGAGEELQARIPMPNAPVVPATNGDLVFRWTSSEIEDVDDTNQVFKLDVPLTLRMPDMIPLKPAIDKNGVLTFQIQNQGNARANSSVTALYINGALVQRYNTQELGPRASQSFKYTATKLVEDTKVVILCDFNAEVEESSEENNRADLPNQSLK